MKPMKIFLRYWFAITSVLSFAAGWVILAHSPKPVQPSKTSNNPSSLGPLPTLPPLNLGGNGSGNNNNGFQLFPVNPSTNSQPFGFSMRSGGS